MKVVLLKTAAAARDLALDEHLQHDAVDGLELGVEVVRVVGPVLVRERPLEAERLAGVEQVLGGHPDAIEVAAVGVPGVRALHERLARDDGDVGGLLLHPDHRQHLAGDVTGLVGDVLVERAQHPVARHRPACVIDRHLVLLMSS